MNVYQNTSGHESNVWWMYACSWESNIWWMYTSSQESNIWWMYTSNQEMNIWWMKTSSWECNIWWMYTSSCKSNIWWMYASDLEISSDAQRNIVNGALSHNTQLVRIQSLKTTFEVQTSLSHPTGNSQPPHIPEESFNLANNITQNSILQTIEVHIKQWSWRPGSLRAVKFHHIQKQNHLQNCLNVDASEAVHPQYEIHLVVSWQLSKTAK